MDELISRQAALGEIKKCRFVVDAIEKISALPSAQPEPLTDSEKRLFLAAITRERQICKEIDDQFDEHELVPACKEIERKVKGALWMN